MELKDNIYVFVDILGEREFESIHELVKEYFRMYIDWKIDGFDEIGYRGHKLIIHDSTGFSDSDLIEEDLRSQVVKINKIEDEMFTNEV